MLMILESVLFVFGIFFFKGKVKHPIWESLKHFLVIVFLEYSLIWRAVNKGWYESTDGIVIWASLSIIYVGVIVFRAKGKRFPSTSNENNAENV